MNSLTTTSADGTPLHVYRWPATGNATGIFIIVHGLAEHARRYGTFAERLAAAGLEVYAFDLRGHGHTADHGHFGTKTRWQALSDDVEVLRMFALETSGHLPVTLFGHSLGSFITQAVMQTRGQHYAAAILSGSATPSRALCRMGALVAVAESACVNRNGNSTILRVMTFGAYARAIKRRTGAMRTRFDWLSSQTEAVDAYIDDPDTGFDMRTAAWRQLLPGIARVQSPQARRQVPIDLPLLIASGEDDPVGHFGRDPRRLADAYTNNGQSDVTLFIYAGARHELLNDTIATSFMHDMLTWLAARGLVPHDSTATLPEAL